MYERRDRVEVGLGKWEFLSHRWGGRMIGEELEVEERISADMGVTVVLFTAFFSSPFCSSRLHARQQTPSW